jgi:hypothetical protein
MWVSISDRIVFLVLTADDLVDINTTRTVRVARSIFFAFSIDARELKVYKMKRSQCILRVSIKTQRKYDYQDKSEVEENRL